MRARRRIKKIFINPQIGQAPITTTAMMSYVLAFMMIDFFLMIVMQVDTPLFYKVTIVTTTPYGFTTESRGECTADSGIWTYLVLIIGLHAALLAYGNVLVYRLRNVPSEFNEGKFVCFSLANNLQTGLLAVMLLLLVSDTPSVTFLVKWFTVYWTATLTLLVMFLPKIQQVHFKREDDDDIIMANNMRKEGKKRSRLATLKKQVSFSPFQLQFATASQLQPLPVAVCDWKP